jgi:hypothetical protein
MDPVGMARLAREALSEVVAHNMDFAARHQTTARKAAKVSGEVVLGLHHLPVLQVVRQSVRPLLFL